MRTSYANQGQNPYIDNVDDEAEFDKTLEALKLLGFSDDENRSIFKILAAILHLGNVKIEASGRGDSEKSQVKMDDPSLPVVAALMEVEEKDLRQWLCNKKVGKNKLFFRAGQVAYMEKLRSDKLKACGIMIQKNVPDHAQVRARHPALVPGSPDARQVPGDPAQHRGRQAPGRGPRLGPEAEIPEAEDAGYWPPEPDPGLASED